MTNTEIFNKLTNAIVTQDIAGCAKLTQEALDAGISPLDIITKGLSPEEGTGLAITFVAEGDIHDIGHRLVTTMLGANGFDILDLGVDVLNETVIEEAAKRKGQKIILVGSALMTTSMLGQKDLMDRLREENLRDSVKCMFGGAPVSDKWIDEIGADATAENAAEAAKVALNIMK
ncbi:cobalamin-dependent protein [Methanosarcina mazei]|uniref:Monomethylamine corrinoid protein 1 n=1 Tax=Methanosarcina mazei TaxID=2209 RepID=A0A0F8J1J7_METMZ|nr:cobalamin-dependent protein [Methanosarcina mazei]KKG62860.1 monomethylamine corrinoid protein 1 [Methanosarcina mazei]